MSLDQEASGDEVMPIVLKLKPDYRSGQGQTKQGSNNLPINLESVASSRQDSKERRGLSLELTSRAASAPYN